MDLVTELMAHRLVAKRYERLGYVVTIAPPLSAIPFSLCGYVPDLLAMKGDDKLLFDVKAPGEQRSYAEYVKADKEIRRHPGWKILFATVGQYDLVDDATSDFQGVDAGAIRAHLHQLERFDGPELAALVVPKLWFAYITALRLLVLQEGFELDVYSDLSILHRAYTNGVISNAEHEEARALLMLRDRLVRSIDLSATPEDCKQLRGMADRTLAQLTVSSVAAA